MCKPRIVRQRGQSYRRKLAFCEAGQRLDCEQIGRRLPVHDAVVEDPRFARLTVRGADALFGAVLRVAFTFASRRVAISASIAGNRAPALDR